MANQLCVKTSNNKYPDCPARMADGRTFTDYRQSCSVNSLLRTSSNSFNSHEYRMYLTRNAETLINLNRQMTFERNKCGPCVKPYNVGTMLPEQRKISCDHHGCLISVNDETGIGYGRQYNSFPDTFFPVHVGNNKTVNCCATPLDNFNQYGLDKVQGDLIELTNTKHNGYNASGARV